MNQTFDKNILIIGGGVSGMSAARVLGSQAVNVHLVEKSDHLGGHASDWACMATDKCQYCGACLSQDLAEQLQQLTNLAVYKESRITSLDKKDGGYHASIKGGMAVELDIDAVIYATGFTPFDPASLDFFEYNEKGVITTAELNRILKDEELPQSLNNNESPSIAFIQCVGSRNREIAHDYCSQVCCKTAVRFADKILYLIPGASVTIFHMDLQICGKMFRTQVDKIRDSVKLIQGIPGKILSTDNNKLRLFQEDTETGARSAFDFDMVVLTIGMESIKENSAAASDLGLNPDKWGFIDIDSKADGNRIYSIGTVNGPMDILTAMEQGVSIAQKAMKDLGIQDATTSKNIAILGNGADGRVVSKAIAESGHVVNLIEEDDGDEAPEGVNLYSNSKIIDISGTVGNFKIKTQSNDTINEIKATAIIVSTGTGIERFSNEKELPESNCIISLNEYKKQTPDDINGRYNNIVFWLDHAGPEWKNNSREVLLSAIGLSESGKNVSIILEKMLVNNLDGQMLYDSARNKGIKFLRVVSPSDVTIATDEGNVKLEVKEATLAGMAIDVPCDLVIIPEKIKANPSNSYISKLLCQDTDSEGFLQSPNPRHRRISSPRRGIYYAGACHDETDFNDLTHEIRTINAHLNLIPDSSTIQSAYAEINPERCGKCLTCFRICPHRAITLNEHEPVISGDACFACGLCVTLCPAVAISIKGSETPVANENKTEGTLIFACKRSAFLAEKTVNKTVASGKPAYQIIPVDCACSLDSIEIINRFMEGAERIMVMTCHPENCRSIYGDISAKLKIERIYKDTGISRSMLSLHTIAANEPEKFRQLIDGAISKNKENSDD